MDIPFELNSEVKQNCLIMTTSGYINQIGGETIAKEFESHFERGISNIILNLSGSKVVNSIGISFLLEILEKLQESNGTLIFTNMDAGVDKMLTIMGIFKFAGKASTVDEALQHFQGK